LVAKMGLVIGHYHPLKRFNRRGFNILGASIKVF